MNRPVLFLVVLASAAGAGYLAWEYGQSQYETSMPVADIQPAPSPEQPPEPQPIVRYPVPETEQGKEPPPRAESESADTEQQAAQTQGSPPGPDELNIPLPDLSQSDPAVRDLLARFFPQQKLDELFVLDNVIKRFVVTVDKIPQKKLPARLRVFEPAPGEFAVEGSGEKAYITAQNSWRYRPFVKLVDAVDTGKAVAWYVHFYPLIQEAYQDLGYPDRYFNDQLVAAIDHLLETPAVSEPIPVVEHVIHYKFADPELEALSAGQKLMIRIGNENARIIKEKLREFRSRITNLAP